MNESTPIPYTSHISLRPIMAGQWIPVARISEFMRLESEVCGNSCGHLACTKQWQAVVVCYCLHVTCPGHRQIVPESSKYLNVTWYKVLAVFVQQGWSVRGESSTCLFERNMLIEGGSRKRYAHHYAASPLTGWDRSRTTQAQRMCIMWWWPLD